MSLVINAIRTWKGETASATSEVWKFVVEASSAEATCTQARTAAGIPDEGDLLEGTSLRARVEATRRENEPTIFDVTVNWELPSSGGASGSIEVKPDIPSGDTVYWNVNISSRGASYQEEIFAEPAEDGFLIVSSSGTRFPNGTLKTYEDELFTVSFNTNNLDIEAIDTARGGVNANELTLTIKGVTKVFPTNTIKLVDAPWDFTYEWTDNPASPDFKASVQLHYRKEGWIVRKLDESMYQRSSSGELTPILDGENNPITIPVPLNGDGQQLTDPGAEPVQLEFFIEDEADFSFLEIIGTGT